MFVEWLNEWRHLCPQGFSHSHRGDTSIENVVLKQPKYELGTLLRHGSNHDFYFRGSRSTESGFGKLSTSSPVVTQAEKIAYAKGWICKTARCTQGSGVVQRGWRTEYNSCVILAGDTSRRNWVQAEPSSKVWGGTHTNSPVISDQKNLAAGHD